MITEVGFQPRKNGQCDTKVSPPSNCDTKVPPPKKHSHLPHIDIKGYYQFITFRTHDSVDNFVKKLTATDKPNKQKQQEIDDYLDSSQYGAYLNGAVLDYLYDFLKSKDGKLYELEAFAIMSNHVHLLIKPIEDLSKIMQILKGASAKTINEILGKSDKFWADDYYDKAIRDEKHFWMVYEYIKNNPLKISGAKAPLPREIGTDTLVSENNTNRVETPLPRFYGVCI